MFASSSEDFLAAVEEADMAIVDLTAPNGLESLRVFANTRGEPLRVFAYAGHVEEALLAEASAIDGVQAMPRSIFFRRLSEILNS